MLRLLNPLRTVQLSTTFRIRGLKYYLPIAARADRASLRREGYTGNGSREIAGDTGTSSPTEPRAGANKKYANSLLQRLPFAEARGAESREAKETGERPPAHGRAARE